MNALIVLILSIGSAFGISWTIGQAIASPKVSMTVVVGVGLVIGNALGIAHAKGWL